MSSALEVLGMSLPYSSGLPALYPGSYIYLKPLFIFINFWNSKDTGMPPGCEIPQEFTRERHKAEVTYIYVCTDREFPKLILLQGHPDAQLPAECNCCDPSYRWID